MSHRPPTDLDEQRNRERLVAHRGLATWGERLVTLGVFAAAAARAGRALPPAERDAATAALLAPRVDATPVEGSARQQYTVASLPSPITPSTWLISP